MVARTSFACPCGLAKCPCEATDKPSAAGLSVPPTRNEQESTDHGQRTMDG